MTNDFNKGIKKILKEEWKRMEDRLPIKEGRTKKVYDKNLLMRVVFSKDIFHILDIEDIAGNNIRIIKNSEAKWLIKQLEEFVKNE